MSLQALTVDRLFSRLSATYGAAWDRAMGSAPIADVKTAWAHELAGFHGRLESIAWALQNLPERVPNVIEFRNLARRAPVADVPLLPEPKADPERLRAELEKLAPVLAQPVAQSVDGRDWARRIVARHEAGEALKRYTLESARMALGMIPGPVMS